MIDWFTVIAQIVNFLILVALLKYFLYGRIVTAMSQREQGISARWEEAGQQRNDAAEELQAARRKKRELDDQREQLLAAIHDEVEAHRQQLTAKVRSDADELQSRWADAIQEETGAFLHDLRLRAAEEVCVIARRALSDLAGANLEQQMVEKFLQMVESLGKREREAVIASLQEENQVAVVQTTHQLTDDLQQSISETLRRNFLNDVDVQFENSGDLLCGIALKTDAHKLAWDLRDYLTSLEQELRKTLEEETASRRSRETESTDVGQ